MARIRKANVVLTIKDDQVERFLSQGYNVIDEQGNVLIESPVKDIGTLRVELADAHKTIEELKARIAELEAEAAPEEPQQDDEPVKPKRTKKQ